MVCRVWKIGSEYGRIRIVQERSQSESLLLASDVVVHPIVTSLEVLASNFERKGGSLTLLIGLRDSGSLPQSCRPFVVPYLLGLGSVTDQVLT
jgi:hypothetical protein